MPTYKAEALVYKRRILDEKNTLITAFTDKGKKLLKVQNVLLKKIYLSSFAHVNLIISERNGIDRIYDSEVIDSFNDLAQDINKMKLAGYYFGIIDRLSLADDNNLELFKVLCKYLYLLKKETQTDSQTDFEKDVLRAEGIYSEDVTNLDFEVIIDGYSKGVFHNDQT